MNRSPALAIAAATIFAATTMIVSCAAGAASPPPTVGGDTRLGPQSADPLRVPLMPPSYYTPGSQSFHSPAPKPPATQAGPRIYYVYPPPYRDETPVHYLYYCPDTRRYYPDVTECRSGWLKVVPDDATTPH
jgi:hypothetical protein